jgi:peptidoglycan glycosyltransferase
MAYSNVLGEHPTTMIGGQGRPRRVGGGGPRGPPKSGWKRWLTWKYNWRTGLAGGVLMVVALLLVMTIAYVTVKVPRPGDLHSEQVATIYANDGSTTLGQIIPADGNRTDVTIDQIPKGVRDAVIAAEDRDFYTNPGFSATGFMRALLHNVEGKADAGGGSTITQQYVKNAMLSSEHTLSRKFKELIISLKMSKSWSKDDILAAYLNTIYFGRNAYGIDAAAKAYFGKPVDKLTIQQGAVLAAAIREPSMLDPELNPGPAHDRWNYVLDGMVSDGALSQSDRTAMQYPAVIPRARAESALDNGPNGLIKTQVLQELENQGISEQQINTQGLKITTTIDPKAQNSMVDAVHKTLQGEPGYLRSAAVAVDPRSGDVRAYYGGDDGVGYDYANAPLQTGSTFKVFGLTAFLQLGHPLSQIFDSSPVTVNGIKITNVEGEACGFCTIAEALKRSLNTSFYRMETSMTDGPEAIADMAHRLGIPDSIPGFGKTLVEPDGSAPNNGIVLGQYSVRAIDMASAYATLAASGVYHSPHFVQKVVAADGTVLLDRTNPAGEQRISGAVADNVTSAMEPIARWSLHHDLADGRPSATKTGTSQAGGGGDANGDKDAWMIGFTPSLSTAVWVGSDNGRAIYNAGGSPVYGSGLPSDIWKETMDGALDGTPVEQFPKPAPIAGQAGVPSWSTPFTPPKTTAPVLDIPQMTQSYITPFPGVTIQVPGFAPQSEDQQVPLPGHVGPTPMSGQPTVGDPLLDPEQTSVPVTATVAPGMGAGAN